MPLVSLQERIRLLSAGYSIPNDGFRLLAVDNIEGGINLGGIEGQEALNPLLSKTDLLVLDNLSTLCANRSESASDAWTPIQEWLLKLRRKGISVLFIHHAGTNGKQRGTSRREDVLDTVIALKRPEDYSPEQGARFEIHFEKLRNRVDAVAAVPFEASINVASIDGQDVIHWSSRDLKPPLLEQAVGLFKDGLTVREVAAILRISKSEAGRLRLQTIRDERAHRSSDDKRAMSLPNSQRN
jgi:putative DNA primase/helicase